MSFRLRLGRRTPELRRPAQNRPLSAAAAGALLCAAQSPKLPPWAFHSPVPAKARIAAVDRLETMLEKKATASNGFKRAAGRLRNEAIVYEPLADNAMRVLRTGKSSTKSLWGVMPLFSADAKVSSMLREFIQNKRAVIGFDPDNPVLMVKMQSPKLESVLPALAKAINDAPTN